MRLVTDPAEVFSRQPRHIQIEIAVREPVSGAILGNFCLQILTDPGGIVGMTTAPVGTPGLAAAETPSVAGRIDPVATSLMRAVEAWLSYLKGRKRSDRTIQAFRQVVTKAARECGWKKPADLTFESVTNWMADQAWMGSTYNRNLSCFKSLCKHLANTGKLTRNPLEDAERADDDGGDGSRAATVEEARRLILYAWVRDQADRRSKGNRALYWLCLFSHAARVNEPRKWRMKHLALDHPVPHIRWRKGMNKGKVDRDCALTAELADQLRLHVAKLNQARAAKQLPPLGPEDKVFPTVPSPHTFTNDRDAAHIAAVDEAGHPFSPHSARKYFATQLGVCEQEKMVDFLMRHTGRVEHRYFKPTLDQQKSAVAKLPRLWPEQAGPSRQGDDSPIVDNSGNSGRDLTRSGKSAHDVSGTQQAPPAKTNSVKRPGPSDGPAECQLAEMSGGLGRAIEGMVRAAGNGCQADRDEESSARPDYAARNRHFVTHNGFEAQNDLADLFLALSRLLRRSSGHDGRSQASPEES